MNIRNIQTSSKDVRELIEEKARAAMQEFVHAIFEQEVAALAGLKHRRGRGNAGVYRCGSDPGSVLISGQRMEVRKPRVKRNGVEIVLKSYKTFRSKDLLHKKILSYMVAGVSTRDYGELLDELSGGLGLSKSSVSRAFQESSKKALEDLRTRSLAGHKWCAVQMDAIYFGGRSVLVALGIDTVGRKTVLGLTEGSSESAVVCTDLLQNLIARGLPADKPFLFIIDGGKGLRKAITDTFGSHFPVQRCTVHKARNIEAYIPDRTHREFRHRWMRFRAATCYDQATAELRTIKDWLSRISDDAVRSLEEAEAELVTAHRYGASRILRRTLCSTNCIESVFSRVRAVCRRVTHWKHSPSQIKRWAAVALLEVEQYAHVKGFSDVDAFLNNLHSKVLLSMPKAA